MNCKQRVLFIVMCVIGILLAWEISGMAAEIDPFEPLDLSPKTENVIIMAFQAPNTPLCRQQITDMDLTAILVRELGKSAYFTVRGGKIMKGVVGDFIGTAGQTIKSIDIGVVELSNGYRWLINQ